VFIFEIKENKMYNIFSILLLFCLVFPYEIGETISVSHQNTDFEICYAPELDPNGDGIFNFSEYNGDINGGQYYVIFLEMMTTW